MDPLSIFLRPKDPSWIWVRYIQYATHRNNFISPPKLAMSMRCLIPLRHLALTSPLGNINGDTHASPQNHQTHKNHGDLKVCFLKQQTWLLLYTANITPSHVRQCLKITTLFAQAFSCKNTFSTLPQLHSVSLFLSFPMRLAAQTQTQTLYSMLPY